MGIKSARPEAELIDINRRDKQTGNMAILDDGSDGRGTTDVPWDCDVPRYEL